MLRILVLLSMLSVISVVLAKNYLPPYLKKCSMSDPNFSKCYVDHGNQAIPSISKGDKKYHFPSMEPFKVDKISIDTNSNLHVNMTNIEMHGFNKTILLASDNDVMKYKFKDSYLIPNIEMTADYELKGNILVLSLEGKGTCTFKFRNVRCVYDAAYERYTKNGVAYLRKATSSLDYDMEHVTIHFDNLFNGNKQLGDEMNKVLNENWKEVADEFKPALSSTVLQIVDTVYGRFLDVVPADELYDP